MDGYPHNSGVCADCGTRLSPRCQTSHAERSTRNPNRFPTMSSQKKVSCEAPKNAITGAKDWQLQPAVEGSPCGKGASVGAKSLRPAFLLGFQIEGMEAQVGNRFERVAEHGGSK